MVPQLSGTAFQNEALEVFGEGWFFTEVDVKRKCMVEQLVC